MTFESPISGAVEGDVDRIVLGRICAHVGVLLGNVYVTDGKTNLLRRLDGFNRAAELWPWAVLVDLDNDETCAPSAVIRWLPGPAPFMRLRVVVRAVEAWLMADRESMAALLRVRVSRIPTDPDSLLDPKSSIVELARTSRTRSIREDLVPRSGSGRRVGPAYSSRMIEFAGQSGTWRPDIARRASSSLNRALDRIEGLAAR